MISLPPGGSSAASRQTRLSFFPPKIDIDLTRPEGNTYGEQAFFRGSTAGWVDVMCLLSGVMDLGRFLVPGDTYSPWISYCTLCSLLCRGALSTVPLERSLHPLPCHVGVTDRRVLCSLPLSPPFYSVLSIPSHLQACIPCVSAGSSDPPGYISYFVVHP